MYFPILWKAKFWYFFLFLPFFKSRYRNLSGILGDKISGRIHFGKVRIWLFLSSWTFQSSITRDSPMLENRSCSVLVWGKNNRLAIIEIVVSVSYWGGTYRTRIEMRHNHFTVKQVHFIHTHKITLNTNKRWGVAASWCWRRMRERVQICSAYIASLKTGWSTFRN